MCTTQLQVMFHTNLEICVVPLIKDLNVTVKCRTAIKKKLFLYVNMCLSVKINCLLYSLFTSISFPINSIKDIVIRKKKKDYQFKM